MSRPMMGRSGPPGLGRQQATAKADREQIRRLISNQPKIPKPAQAGPGTHGIAQGRANAVDVTGSTIYPQTWYFASLTDPGLQDVGIDHQGAGQYVHPSETGWYSLRWWIDLQVYSLPAAAWLWAEFNQGNNAAALSEYRTAHSDAYRHAQFPIIGAAVNRYHDTGPHYLGVDAAQPDAAVIGARFFLMDSSMAALSFTSANIGLTLNLSVIRTA